LTAGTARRSYKNCTTFFISKYLFKTIVKMIFFFQRIPLDIPLTFFK